MTTQERSLSPSTATGSLGVMHLKRYWERVQLIRRGAVKQGAFNEEWNLDVLLFAALGLGIEQIITHLYQASTDFEAFEEWVLQQNNGQPDQAKIKAFNAQISHQGTSASEAPEGPPVLTAEDLAFWDANGYVIVRKVITEEACDRSIAAICDFLEIERDNPATWYNSHPAKQKIMVQLFQHPQLDENRHAPRIRRAYEQLYGHKDLWVNTDRVSFNPPETPSYKFQGPDLHWDISLKLPIPFSVLGLMYLSDTKSNQGAFTVVPGFQNRIESWINSLPPGFNPREANLHALGSFPIAANAGDFIIWHQALPHGSSPNTAELPRFVQYINYQPLDVEVGTEWI